MEKGFILSGSPGENCIEISTNLRAVKKMNFIKETKVTNSLQRPNLGPNSTHSCHLRYIGCGHNSAWEQIKSRQRPKKLEWTGNAGFPINVRGRRIRIPCSGDFFWIFLVWPGEIVRWQLRSGWTPYSHTPPPTTSQGWQFLRRKVWDGAGTQKKFDRARLWGGV